MQSDHASLTYLRCAKEPVAQQARWLDFVEQFDITVQHRSGSAHRAADALSRRPCETSGLCRQCTKRVGHWMTANREESRCSGVITRGRARAQEDARGCQGGEVLNPTRVGGGAGDPPPEEAPRHQDLPFSKSTPPPSLLEGMGWFKEELQALQREDLNIGLLQLWLETGAHPPREFMNCESSELKSYWAQFDSFMSIKVLCIGDLRGLMELTTICNCSCRGHFVNVFWRLYMHKPLAISLPRRRWTRCRREHFGIAGRWMSNCCKSCNEFYRGRAPKQAGLKPLFAVAPMEVLHVDLTGPHVTSQGYRYIMTACDSFTRFVIAVPLRSKTALAVARALVHEVVPKFGIPHSILTDLGGEFQNELWQEMCWASIVSGPWRTVLRLTGK